MRNFVRNYLFKVLIGLAVLEIGYLLWNQNKNKKPEIKSDFYSVFSRQKTEMRPLINDMDKDNDSISIVEFTEPLHGKVSQNGRLLYYQSNSNVRVKDSFAYVITDGRKKSHPGYIKLEVLDNNEPLSLNDTIVVFNGNANELQILANDIDKENDSISFDTISIPLFGKIQTFENKLLYKPKDSFTGIDSFNYVITDGFKKSRITKVQLIVKNGEFSSNPYFGNASNYTFHKACKSDILIDDNNKRLVILNNSKHKWSGVLSGFCTINNRDYQNNFNLRFKAKSPELKQWGGYAVIFSYKDIKNYCCIYFLSHDNGRGQIDGYCVKNGNAINTMLKNIKLYADTKYHDIEVQKNADSISIKFDGKFIMGASNSNFLNEGSVGFGTYLNTLFLDDVYITGK